MINIKICNNSIDVNTTRKIKKIINKDKLIFLFYKRGYENLNYSDELNFNIQDFEKLKAFFQNNNFIDIIAIFENNKLCLANAIDGQQLNIFEENNSIYFSTDQFFLKKKLSFENLYLALNTKYNYWLPNGINEIKTLIPGMISLHDFNKGLNLLKSDLIFNFNEFGINSHHDEIVDNLIIKFDNAFTDLKKVNSNWELLLSSGLDSALYMAFAQKHGLKLNFNTFDIDITEAESAFRFAKYYNVKMSRFVRGGIKYGQELDLNTDLSKYLNFIKPVIENKFEVMSIFNLLIDFAFHTSKPNNFILEGSEFPTALCIQHLTNYPNFFSSGLGTFNPKINAEKRLQILKNYKISYESYILNIEEMKKYFKSIDERYYNTLSKVFYGTRSNINLSSFTINKRYLNNHELIKDAVKKRGEEIISILNHLNILDNLGEFTERKNIALQKTLSLINGTSRASTTQNQTNDTSLLVHFRPALNSSIISELLNTSFDEKLINYPKWHLFEIFKKTAGYDFFDLTYKSIFFEELYKRTKQKIKIKQKNPKKIFFKNKSFIFFIQENYKEEIRYIINYLGLSKNLSDFFKAGFHFMIYSKIINLSALLKNNKIDI